jgi:hypothetical protein
MRVAPFADGALKGSQFLRSLPKTERLGPANATLLAIPGGDALELDQPRLLGVEHRGRSARLSRNSVRESLGVFTVLEPHHRVISATHDDYVAARRVRR